MEKLLLDQQPQATHFSFLSLVTSSFTLACLSLCLWRALLTKELGDVVGVSDKTSKEKRQNQTSNAKTRCKYSSKQEKKSNSSSIIFLPRLRGSRRKEEREKRKV